jgi:hypothetical protein
MEAELEMTPTPSSPFIGNIDAPALRVLWRGDEFRIAQESPGSETFLLSGLMNTDLLELFYLEDSSQVLADWSPCPRHLRVVVGNEEDGPERLAVSSRDKRYHLPLRTTELASRMLPHASLQPDARINQLAQVGDSLGVDIIVSEQTERLEYPYGVIEHVHRASAITGVADALILVGLYLRSRGCYVWSHFPKDCNSESAQELDKVAFYDLAGRYLVDDDTSWEVMLGKWDIQNKLNRGANRLSPLWRRMVRALGNALEARDRVHVSLAQAAAQPDLRAALSYHTHAMHAFDQFLGQVGEGFEIQGHLLQAIIGETTSTGLARDELESVKHYPYGGMDLSPSQLNAISVIWSQLRESLDLRRGLSADIVVAMKDSTRSGDMTTLDRALIDSFRGSCKGQSVKELVDNLHLLELTEAVVIADGSEQIDFEVGRLTETLLQLAIRYLNDIMEAIPTDQLPQPSRSGKPQEMVIKVGTSITYARLAFAWMLGIH